MKKKSSSKKNTIVHALKVNQWLKEWDGQNSILFDDKQFRRKPEKHFYMFTLSAKKLRELSNIYRRDSKGGKPRSSDTNIQRSHEESRSRKIAEYIKYGYPWSDLTTSQRKEKYSDLRKPGWLPTAIVVNILREGDERGGKKISKEDIITVSEKSGAISIVLPKSYKDKNWKPSSNFPIEVIDGQHRLLAFDDSIDDDYELPVVAFSGLDLSWQAYLFWTINIKPKRINPSLAFDLYPLLRTEDWLDRFEGHKIYREARAQELTENIWAYPASIWHQRINMLGEKGGDSATQAAWIRALLKTYVKASEGKDISLGGLFGAPVGQDKMTLSWSRVQQAAFLITVWNSLATAVKKNNSKWTKALRAEKYGKPINGDAAFFGPHSLLNNDQGLTVLLNVTNDFFFLNATDLRLNDWKIEDMDADIEFACKDLAKRKEIIKFINKLNSALVTFDWRSSASTGLTQKEKYSKLALRGGSGYKIFREMLVAHLAKNTSEIGITAKKISSSIRS